MKIKKIIVTLFFVFVTTVLVGCSTFQAIVDSTGRYFVLLSPPVDDPSDQCNMQVQKITRISNAKYPVDSIVKSLEGSFAEALRIAVLTGNFDVFLRGASTNYLTHIMSKGGIRTFLTDINKDASNQQQMNYAVDELKRCRTDESRRVARRIKRTPSSHEANQEKDTLLRRTRRDNEYIKAVNKNFGKRISLYEKTSSEIKSSNATSEVRYINISSLNVRDRPTTSGSTVLGSLSRNAMVKVVENIGSWLKIEYRGQIAFISKKYTRTSAPAQTTDVNKAIVSAKDTQKEIDQNSDQMLVEIDEILASDGVA